MLSMVTRSYYSFKCRCRVKNIFKIYNKSGGQCILHIVRHSLVYLKGFNAYATRCITIAALTFACTPPANVGKVAEVIEE